MTRVYCKGPIELRLGDYRDALADVEPDAVITDPPYGERTHDGNQNMRERFGSAARRSLDYARWTPSDVQGLFGRFPSAAWIFGMTSDDLVPAWRAMAEQWGRLDFAPVPILQHRVRLGGDGPASGTVYGMASRVRTRAMLGWGSLPGWYEAGIDRSGVIGGKPLDLMRSIVRDYSRPGDIVCDPCAGGATTLIAAALEGRRAIGAELDPETFAKACARIERTALTPPLPGLAEPPRRFEQVGLDLDSEAAE